MSLTIEWPGQFGRTHAFELYPIGTTFNEVGGVYIFCKPYPGRQWQALYVGETGNLNERLNTALQRHQAWPSCQSGGATHICAKVIGSGVSGRMERLALETELRHSLNPPCNRQAA
ncbi:hypothetical protein Q9K01_01110 [Qipengyuania sp. DY56-A-20]|uniref:GIY-YIG domain-containing protein n=1 Tax=Qipengyuania benthica TaxID=3067651 RepID=A0ABT9H4J4_9SPHN|nr:hypothetical protein [Qipengyuania sp. DY56-A-20]MDP4538226.1 hypothetical protein [Qipengyuania sp. DY56-A-20]